MMTSQPNWLPHSPFHLIQQRASLLHSIRQYFFNNNVCEVEVPILSQFATTDPSIDSLYLDLNCLSQCSKPYYLHTSPEFAMKRLLAAWKKDIYYLGRVFRKEEIGRWHNPEFTMLEWYRIAFDHHDLMNDINHLLSSVTSYEETQRISYADLFMEHYQINPHTIQQDALIALVHDTIDSSLSSLTKNDCLDLLFTHKIQPTLKSKHRQKFLGIFVYDYPVSMKAGSRLIKDIHGQSVAARFELFIHGVEIANGYYELDDPNEQLKRFQNDQEIRKKNNAYPYPYDENVIQALCHGLPDCSGVALGVDRLHMLLTNSQHIKKTLIFDFYRA